MRKVKFILVALVAVVVAGIAFAVNGAVPEKNQNGYLYNPATDQYITSSAVMGFEGVQFTISDKVDCGDSFGSDDASIAEAGYTYVRFKFADGTNNFMRMTSNGVVCQNSGYHKWAVKESKNGLIIRCIYTSTQSSGALSPFAQQGYYLTPDADGKLVLLEEPTEASYWEYVDPDTYQERLENEANAAIALPKIIKKAQELLDKPMSKVAKQALETALATYGEGYTGKAFPAAMALAEAYDEAVASIVAYKGILSSYEMHKSMLKDNPNALAEYEDQMADILEDLENGDIMGNGMEEMAAIAKQYFLIQDIEAKNVLVSMAGDGALLLDENGKTHICGVCKGKVKNSVGAGDSMVAGFVAGSMDGDYEYALKLGTATGGATAFSDGLATKEKIAELLRTL